MDAAAALALEAHRKRIGEQAGAFIRPADIVPNPGPQSAFLRCPATEVMYGGSAGGGKTIALLLWAMRHIGVPGYRALLLRRQFPQLRRTLLLKSKDLYPYAGGRWVAGEKTWIFPSGATIELGSADKESDIERYLGSEYAACGFDEATYFAPYQFRYMLSRLRTTVPGLNTQLRLATNPGGPSHDYFLRRYAPWLYPPGEPGWNGPYRKPGDVLWFLPIRDSDEERIVPAFTPGATSRTFFGARVTDTPQLAGTQYEANLNALDRVTRARQKDGDWMAREAAGEMFKREWFDVVDASPLDVFYRVRYWDLAGTAQKNATASSAWTAGVLLACTHSGLMFVEDMVREQLSPGEVEDTIARTQAMDEGRFGVDARAFETIIERDPAQAGKFQAWYFGTRMGIKAIAPVGDKVARARIPSAQVEHGNMKLVRGRWNEPFLREAESFPDTTKDQVDSLSGATRRAMVKLYRELKRNGRDPRALLRIKVVARIGENAAPDEED